MNLKGSLELFLVMVHILVQYILILVFASKCPKTFSECHTDLLLWKPSADSVGLAEKLLGADGQ